MKVGIVHAPALARALSSHGVATVTGTDARGGALAVRAALDAGEQVAVVVVTTPDTAAMLRAWSASVASAARVVHLDSDTTLADLGAALGVEVEDDATVVHPDGSVSAPAAPTTASLPAAPPSPPAWAGEPCAPTSASSPADVPPSWGQALEPVLTSSSCAVAGPAWMSPPAPAGAVPALGDTSRVLVVLRPKGGVGATSLALAAAEHCAQAGTLAPLVVDLCTDGSGLAEALGATSLPTIADINGGASVSQVIAAPETIRRAGGPRTGASVAVAVGPGQVAPTTDQVRQVIALGASRSGLTVLDTPPLSAQRASERRDLVAAVLSGGARALVLTDASRSGVSGAGDLAAWAHTLAPARVLALMNLCPQQAMPAAEQVAARLAPAKVLGAWPYDAGVPIGAAQGRTAPTLAAMAAAVAGVVA